ncbi:hypothetical protein EAE96_006792 [Botrytis aclada]|nr:hypothetical protein EAE96_006792 [Botrytis aclada]
MLLSDVDQVASPPQPNTLLPPSIDLARAEHESEAPHQEFLKPLKGQTAIIPNLYSLFPEWKQKLHKDHERARNDVLNPWLARWVDDPHTLAKLQRAQFTIFAAIICSDNVSFEKLCTVAKFFVWCFVWDDHKSYAPTVLKSERRDHLEY